MPLNITNWWLTALFCAISVPLSLFIFLCSVTISKISTPQYEEPNIMSPTKCLFSLLGPFAFMMTALRRKSVNKSGAALGIVMAIILSLANYAFFFSLAAFVFTSSRATKFRSNIKRDIEKDFKEGEGQRNWVQVFCNGAIATQLAILYLLDVGSSEKSINFQQDYRASWLGVAVMSAFACCSGDTWASELGCVLSKHDPFLITNFERVPRGTNGGVSWIGLLFSFLGGMVVGLAYYITIQVTVSDDILVRNPLQCPLILCGGIAGLFGSVVDSLLGATLQYSGIDQSGKIVDRPGKGVRYISGMPIINNHIVNLISSLITAVCMPFVAIKYWPKL